MPIYLFWLFSTVMLIGGTAVIAFRNPVSSALSVVTCFVGLAGLFIGLSAFFVGVIQILVYTGAVMVLFIFIIMLLDLNTDKKRTPKLIPLITGLGIVIAFTLQLIGVISKTPQTELPKLDLADAPVVPQEQAERANLDAYARHRPFAHGRVRALIRGACGTEWPRLFRGWRGAGACGRP